MKKENIRKAGKNAGLEPKTLKVFVEFFAKRFPNESDNIQSYVNEWANRFKGNPVLYMDEESKNIYYEVL